jgi:sorting nexin-1/2
MAEREQQMASDDVEMPAAEDSVMVDIKDQAAQAKTKFVSDLMNLTDYNEAKAVAEVKEQEQEVEDPRAQKFTVSNPVKIQGHIKYTVTGEDAQGEFTEVRRYKEFFALRNILVQRWPGVFIPAIPEKQILGNKDDQFVEERRLLLERFMKEISKFEYLTHSQEFKVFARDRGDVEKILSQLPKQSPMMILEKYRLNFKVDENRDATEISKMKEGIRDFHSFVKRALSVMEHQKDQLKGMIKVSDDRYK